MNKTIGNPKFLEKKAPARSPRYNDVGSVVDSGSSFTKYLRDLEEKRTNYKYRSNEIFKRLKIVTFAQLMLEVSLEIDLKERLKDAGRGEMSPPSVSDTTADLIYRNEGVTKSPPPLDEFSLELPFLLLDTREEEEYNKCHIVASTSYPHTMMSRASNYFTKDIYAYRNVPGKFIILYDEDERYAAPTATKFVERGIDNVYLLSGGLKVLAKKIDGLIVGTLPVSCRPPKSKKLSRKSSVMSPRSATRADTAMSMRSDLSDTRSVVSTLSFAVNQNRNTAGPDMKSPQLSSLTETMEFKIFDLDALKHSLETAMESDNTTVQSRAASRRTNLTRA